MKARLGPTALTAEQTFRRAARTIDRRRVIAQGRTAFERRPLAKLR